MGYSHGYYRIQPYRRGRYMRRFNCPHCNKTISQNWSYNSDWSDFSSDFSSFNSDFSSFSSDFSSNW